MAKYATINASGAMLLINLIQVTESISGSVMPLAMFMVVKIERTCGRKHQSEFRPVTIERQVEAHLVNKHDVNLYLCICIFVSCIRICQLYL